MNVMNLANRIKVISQQLMKETDPDKREDLEAELAELEEQLEKLQENHRYDFT